MTKRQANLAALRLASVAIQSLAHNLQHAAASREDEQVARAVKDIYGALLNREVKLASYERRSQEERRDANAET